jgi:hypothetical protein
MLRRRLLERVLLPALIAGACGGESSDLFDSSGSPTSTGGDDDSAGEGPEVTGGKATAAGGSNGGAVVVTGGRASAGAVNGGNSEGGEPSGGVESGGRASTGGRSSTGGSNGGGGATGGKNQGGGVTAGATNGGVSNGGVSNGGANQGGSKQGGANQGGAPVAGSAGTTICTDSDGGDQTVRGTTKGTNGTFEDECDGGDLVEYSCETIVIPGPCAAAAMSPDEDLRPVPPIDDCQVPTGLVVEERVHCGGRCEQGTCFYWCPTLADEVLVTRNGTNRAELTNLRTEDVYACEITYEAENLDCRGSAQGRIFQVFSVGLCDAEALTIGVDLEDEPGVLACSYSCSYQ